MIISGVKFEKQCFYISRDILHSVFYNFSCTPYDVITCGRSFVLFFVIQYLFESQALHL